MARRFVTRDLLVQESALEFPEACASGSRPCLGLRRPGRGGVLSPLRLSPPLACRSRPVADGSLLTLSFNPAAGQTLPRTGTPSPRGGPDTGLPHLGRSGPRCEAHAGVPAQCRSDRGWGSAPGRPMRRLTEPSRRTAKGLWPGSGSDQLRIRLVSVAGSRGSLKRKRQRLGDRP